MDSRNGRHLQTGGRNSLGGYRPLEVGNLSVLVL